MLVGEEQAEDAEIRMSRQVHFRPTHQDVLTGARAILSREDGHFGLTRHVKMFLWQLSQTKDFGDIYVLYLVEPQYMYLYLQYSVKIRVVPMLIVGLL